MTEVQRVQVQTKEALFKELHKKADEILITGTLAKKIFLLKQQQLTETEEMGVALGSGGLLTILSTLFNKISTSFTSLSKEETASQEAIIQLYYIKKIDPETTLLRLKQLDY